MGIKLPDSLSSETKQKFDDIIRSHTAFREQPPEAGTSTDGQSVCNLVIVFWSFAITISYFRKEIGG